MPTHGVLCLRAVLSRPLPQIAWHGPYTPWQPFVRSSMENAKGRITLAALEYLLAVIFLCVHPYDKSQPSVEYLSVVPLQKLPCFPYWIFPHSCPSCVPAFCIAPWLIILLITQSHGLPCSLWADIFHPWMFLFLLGIFRHYTARLLRFSLSGCLLRGKDFFFLCHHNTRNLCGSPDFFLRENYWKKRFTFYLC